jgi:hypothetical protein
MSSFRTADEGAHTPTADPLWQESLIFIWWDEHHGIGGLHRIGHLPNQGTANYWNALMLVDGLRYRADVHGIPLRDADCRPDGLTAGGQALLPLAEGGGRVDFDDGHTELHLTYTDYFPMCEVWEHGTGGEVEADMAAAHFETSGHVHGTVRIREGSCTIDGTFHRDHSWGPRDWEHLAGHRWIVGTAGPAFAFSGAVMLGTADLVFGGYVIRDGQRYQADGVDIIVGIEPDGVSARNATAVWRLRNGDTVVIDCQPINGVMLGHGNYIEVDQLAHFAVRGDSTSGWCDIEISTNHRLHNQPVRLAVAAGLQRGFSHARGPISLAETLTNPSN